MKFSPRQDFIIVKMEEPPKATKAGILLMESTFSEDKMPAVVMAIGPGRMTDYGVFITVDDLSVNDRIIFNKFSAYELDKDERLYALRGGEIICKLNE